MINIIIRNSLRFIFLVLFQVLVLNNVQFLSFVNPYFYILFIILLPFETPRWLLLVLAFILGFTIDAFCDSPGLHTSASVFAAFIRPGILSLFSPRDGYEPGTKPQTSYYGFAWFIKYSVFIVLAHHMFLFIMENFSFTYLGQTFLRIIISSIFTMVLVISSQLFMSRK